MFNRHINIRAGLNKKKAEAKNIENELNDPTSTTSTTRRVAMDGISPMSSTNVDEAKVDEFDKNKTAAHVVENNTHLSDNGKANSSLVS